MDRRDFIKISAAGAGALAVGGQAVAKDRKTKVEKVETRLPIEGYLNEPARQIPVVSSADVVVVGGGPAGVAAAIAAAREGADVLMIEKQAYLGGLWTGGLVLPLLCTHGLEKSGSWAQAIDGICGEICTKLTEMDMLIDPGKNICEPNATMYLLEQMTQEAGVRMMYFAYVTQIIKSGDRVEAVVLESKSGRVAVRCKAVVDCSGDGDVMHFVGEDYSEIKYMIGQWYRLGNVDRVDKEAPGFVEQNIGRRTPLPSVNYGMAPNTKDQDGLDILNLTRLQLKYRKEIWEQVQQLRKQPGYEQIYLSDLGTMLGVRVTRVMNSRHNVTLAESMTYASFEDSIGVSGASTTLKFNGRKYTMKERPIWQIPYRAITPKNCPNLLVAGRCFGFEEALAWDAREIGTCLVTGQAAGAAAALAIKKSTSVQEVDVRELQTILRNQKVRLD